MRNGVSARRLTGISSQRSHCGHSTPPVCRRTTHDERVKRRRKNHSKRGAKRRGKAWHRSVGNEMGMKNERGTAALTHSPQSRRHHCIRHQFCRRCHGQLYVDPIMKGSARDRSTNTFTLYSRRVQERPQEPQQGRRKERPLEMRCD